jgi:hypothetical protein
LYLSGVLFVAISQNIPKSEFADVHKSSQFIALKVVTCLHLKWLLSGTKGGRFIGQKVAVCLHKRQPIYCTESGRFLAQKLATYLHKKQLIYCTQAAAVLH